VDRMQFVPGFTLTALLRSRTLDARCAVTLPRQVVDGLGAAHAAGLAHHDVKPANVLVDDADHAYLGDLGLTRAGTASAMTVTGRLVGTVAYLAPGRQGDAATPASDRCAFAAMAFECLTGTRVFPRVSDMANLHAHTRESPSTSVASTAPADARQALRDGELFVVVLDIRSNSRRLV